MIISVINGQVSNQIAPPAGSPTAWWDPDIQAYQDNGTTLALLNNAPIELLKDQFGSLDVSNTGGTARPLLQTNAINGHSAMLFGDSGNPTVLNNSSSLATGTTWIFAINQVTWAFLGAIFGGFTLYPALLQYSSTPTIEQYSGLVSVSPAVGSWAVITWQNDASSYNKLMQINLNTPSTHNSPTQQMISGFEWGYNTFSAGFPYGNFLLGRSAYYDTVLTGSTLTDAIQSFGTYYGLF